ncbi:hypothetical protein EMPS_07741 [Entomortierella parvispora]|uniref:Uncharacterized protein n=1 Tax=Entomortierella parvispora TaxID=205924 RepID=A0A9P3LYQ9_9FUNG|nr:hypothetical protein EMPS_07741 [Entomortierella parvispora]
MVRKMEAGIFGVGAVADQMVELPMNTDEIAGFLDGGSLTALLRVGLHNSDFADMLKEGYRKAKNREILLKMTGGASTRKEGPPIIFTPKKKQQRRSSK